MSLVALGDVCRVTTGQSAPQEPEVFGSFGTPFVRAGSLERLCNGESEESLELVPPDQAAKHRLKVFPKNTVVFAKSGMSAKVGRVYRLRRECHLVSHLAAVLPCDDLDPSYLHRWFEYRPPSRLIDNDAYPSIKTSTLEKIGIPLPPISEQRRIAAILDKADALRTKRREAIAKLDQLLQSVFLDMFGDPIVNPMNWNSIPFSELLERIESGASPVCQERPVQAGEWGVLKLGAVTRCVYDPSSNKALPAGVRPSVDHEVKAGDLLFTRKNTRDLVAACAYVEETPPGLLMPDLIFRLKLKADAPVCPRYLQALMTWPTKRKEVQALAGGSAGSMPNISKAKLSQLGIEMPPVALQHRYGSFAAAIVRTRRLYKQAEESADACFLSLQAKAFSGAL